MLGGARDNLCQDDGYVRSPGLARLVHVNMVAFA